MFLRFIAILAFILLSPTCTVDWALEILSLVMFKMKNFRSPELDNAENLWRPELKSFTQDLPCHGYLNLSFQLLLTIIVLLICFPW